MIRYIKFLKYINSIRELVGARRYHDVASTHLRVSSQDIRCRHKITKLYRYCSELENLSPCSVEAIIKENGLSEYTENRRRHNNIHG